MIETSASSEEASITVRHSVIGGLVAALMPWEHSKRSQQAALLVLGNIIENDLETDLQNDRENDPDSAKGTVVEKDLAKNPKKDPQNDRENGPDNAKETAGSAAEVHGRRDEAPPALGNRGCVKALVDALVAEASAGIEDGADGDGLDAAR